MIKIPLSDIIQADLTIDQPSPVPVPGGRDPFKTAVGIWGSMIAASFMVSK